MKIAIFTIDLCRWFMYENVVITTYSKKKAKRDDELIPKFRALGDKKDKKNEKYKHKFCIIN